MTFKTLLSFVKEEDLRLRSYYKELSPTERERLYSRTIKLIEEVGELCNEILVSQKDQRKEKLKDNIKELEEEFADVIITTALLALTTGIDIEKSLEEKIRKIEQRYQ